MERSGRRLEAEGAHQRLSRALLERGGPDPSPALRRLRRSTVAPDQRGVDADGPIPAPGRGPAPVSNGDRALPSHVRRPAAISPQLADIAWEIESDR